MASTSRRYISPHAAHDDVIKWSHFPRYWPLCGEFTGDRWRPVTRSFDVLFDLRLNERLNKQSWGWWFETLLRPLWRHSNEIRFPSTTAAVLWIWKKYIENHQTFNTYKGYCMSQILITEDDSHNDNLLYRIASGNLIMLASLNIETFGFRILILCKCSYFVGNFVSFHMAKRSSYQNIGLSESRSHNQLMIS